MKKVTTLIMDGILRQTKVHENSTKARQWLYNFSRRMHMRALIENTEELVVKFEDENFINPNIEVPKEDIESFLILARNGIKEMEKYISPQAHASYEMLINKYKEKIK